MSFEHFKIKLFAGLFLFPFFDISLNCLIFSVYWIPILYLKFDLQYFLAPVTCLFTMMFPMLYKNFGLMQSYLSTFGLYP